MSAFFGCSSLTSVTIPNSVTSIEYNAFENCSGLTSVIIPNSVRSIGFKAFSNCSSLTSVIIPNSVTVISRNSFEGCSGLTSINIPNSVTIIGDYAFYSCSVLTSVTVEAKTPITISDNVFSNRANATLYVPAGSKAAYEAADYWKEFGTILESIEGSTFTAQTTEGWDMVFTILDEDAKTCQVGYLDGSQDKVAVDKGRVEGSLTIPESVNDYTVVKIGKHAFNNVYRMTSVTIPNTVTSIDEYAFRDCRGLTSITIPNSVTSIGNHAFSYCSGLTSITIPNSVTSIGQYAFHACNGLTSVTIPQNVTSIGHGVFASCPNLTSLSVEAGNTKYDSRNNCNAIIETETNTLIFGTNNTIIPNSVTAIGKLAFNGCSNITSITIPNSVTTIEDGAFSWCSGLTSIIIPSSVTFIGQDAFMGCYGLTSLSVEAANTKYDSRNNCNAIIETETNKLVSGTINTVIPNSVTVIGNNAFYNLWGLTSITIPNSVTSIEDDAFNLCGGMTSITIPNSVTSIGNGAFQNCSRLTSVTVEAKTPITISDNVFTNRANATLYVPEGSKAAYEAADYWKDFKYIKSEPDPVHIRTEVIDGIYYNLYSDYTAEVTKTPDDSPKYSGAITIPTSVMYNTAAYSVTSIGDEAFDNCRSLTSVTIPNSVTSIGNSAFADCNGLTSITIPNSVTSIGIYAFLDCTSLTSITIPNRVTTLSRAAFTNCISLTSVTIPNSVLSIGGDVFRDCSGLTSITIPNSVTTIGSRAFAGCSGLTSLSVEDGNTKYDSRNNCNAIIETETNRLVFGTNITIIPNSVTAIGSEAFFDCRGLTSITIPNSVTTIENDAFYQCFSLTSVTVEAKTPITISDNTFSTRTNATLYVPAGSKSAYEAVYYWRDFKEIIEMNDNPVSEYTDEQGVKYSLNADGKTYSVSGYTDACSGDITISSSVKGCSVTSIGNNAFENSQGLTSVTIPSSVTSIGDGAFQNCDNLTSIFIHVRTPLSITENVFTNRANATLKVPDGSTVAYKAANYWKEFGTILEGNFSDITVKIGELYYNLVSKVKTAEVTSNANIGYYSGEIVIPQSVTYNGEEYIVTSIGDNAFSGSSDLISITIPNNVTSIGYGAFGDCIGLTSITIPNSVISLSGFSGCSGLTSVTIPNSVTSIGNIAFRNCSGLTSVTIPNSVTSIGESAFSGCSSLTSVTIPNSVTTIGNNAFSNCSGLTSVTIPNSVTFIGDWTFSFCSGLTSVTIPNCVTSIGESVFTDCGSLSSLTIPNSVTSIGFSAFYNCSSLTSLTIPNSVTSIDWYAFQNCSGLTSLTIPNSVTSIGRWAFMGCSGLISITIGSGVTSIEEKAFSKCSELTDVYCYAEQPSDYPYGLYTKTDAFEDSNIENVTLHVPKGSLDAYKTVSPWKNFKSIVKIDLPKYLLTYIVDGEEYKIIEIEEGESITPEAEPTKEHYTFSGWSEIPETMPAQDITVTGTFSLNKHKLIYKVDGADYKSYDVEYGAAITPEPAPTKEHYTFSGWSEVPETMPDNDVTVTGTLSADKFKLIYKVDGADYKSFDVEYGSSIAPEATPTKEGYTFSGWSEIPETMPAKDVTVTGTFSINKYKLIYKVDGSAYKSYDVEYGATITPEAAPTKEGYTFSGWSDIPKTMPAKDVTVTGTFSANVIEEEEGEFEVTSENTVEIISDDNVSGAYSIPESISHNGVSYSVTSIGDGAFMGNTNLTDITIPSSITSIGSGAFSGCSNLKTITVNIEKPISITTAAGVRGGTRSTSSVFEGVDLTTCILYVPEGSVDAYKAAPGWKEFKNILAIGTTGIYGIVVSNGEAFDVFSISGQKVKAKATSLDGLPKGIYIINGKKVIKQ